jgi:hypothetical protein
MNGLKQLAIEAGMYYREIEDEFCKADVDGVPMEMLEAFAKLVAAKEREACAQIADKHTKASFMGAVGAAIRAREWN